MAAITVGGTTCSLTMTFLTETGDKVSVTVPDVKSTLNDEDIQDLMDIIIANDPLVSKKGAIKSMYSARLTEVAKGSYTYGK